jgi:hypothetical protein
VTVECLRRVERRAVLERVHLRREVEIVHGRTLIAARGLETLASGRRTLTTRRG